MTLPVSCGPFRADFGNDLLRGGRDFFAAHLLGQIAQHHIEFGLFARGNLGAIGFLGIRDGFAAAFDFGGQHGQLLFVGERSQFGDFGQLLCRARLRR